MTVTASSGSGAAIVDVATMPGQLVTTPTHTVVTVGATTTVGLAANVNRVYALFVNDSDETIYLKMGTTAALNAGFRLNAGGGSYEMSGPLGNLYRGAINAICASGSKKLLVTEGV